MSSSRPFSADEVVVGCVTEDNPKYLGQTLRLVQSIRWFGGELAQARVVVGAVEDIDAHARRALEGLGAEIRVVRRFDARNGSANRLSSSWSSTGTPLTASASASVAQTLLSVRPRAEADGAEADGTDKSVCATRPTDFFTATFGPARPGAYCANGSDCLPTSGRCSTSSMPCSRPRSRSHVLLRAVPEVGAGQGAESRSR